MLRTMITCPDLREPGSNGPWQPEAGLAAQWRDLAPATSPFLSWEWVGCEAALRFPDPVLVTTLEGDVPVGLALFNRRRGRLGTTLHLHASGDPELDGVFIEHNGVVAVPGREAEVLAATLAAAGTLGSRVVLRGVGDAVLAAARRTNGLVARLHSQAAPYAPLPPTGPLLPLLSRNTRAQLRRSDRVYAAQGPIGVARAETAEVALDWLERLLALHEASWSARGVASGFARPAMQRFHRALLRRGVPTGLVHLLRISAGDEVIGYLLNLAASGRVMNYQGGFAYGRAGPHGKPGLTCHAAAMAHARAEGAQEYDFLAGDSRFKRSLAPEQRTLHWFELCRPASVAGAEALLRLVLRR